jgi:hypothetical protein
MRTLSRPMFNMGGPIKQGIMQGIREPHQIGQVVGRIAPYAAKAFQRVKGLFGKTVPVRHTPITRVTTPGTTPGIIHKGYPGSTTGGKWQPGKEVTEQIFTPGYLGKTTEAQLAQKLWQGKGLIGKPVKAGAKFLYRTPTASIPLVYMGGKWLLSDGTPAPDQNKINEQAGQHGPFDHTKTDKKKIDKAQAAFAEAQRDTRVKKYLDMMGYDRSKKTAVADALIDASKIVSERGHFKGDVTRDLINPIIQATSKRFDKPEQIREAVGLMSVKAAITKDLEDPTVQAYRLKQIEKLDKELDSGVAGKLLSYMAAKKGKVKGDELVDFVRLSANEEGKNFTMVTDEQVQAVPGWENKSAEEVISFIAKDDGVYMMGDTVIEVEGGKPTRIK